MTHPLTRMVLTSCRRNRFTNFPHRSIQPHKHGPRNNVMSDIEFGYFADARDCAHVSHSQSVPRGYVQSILSG
jgi:hypothetical protein